MCELPCAVQLCSWISQKSEEIFDFFKSKMINEAYSADALTELVHVYLCVFNFYSNNEYHVF